MKKKMIARIYEESTGQSLRPQDMALVIPFAERLLASCPNCVSRFDEDEVPVFSQGAPTHELQGVVTAEECIWMVAEIELLRALNASNAVVQKELLVLVLSELLDLFKDFPSLSKKSIIKQMLSEVSAEL